MKLLIPVDFSGSDTNSSRYGAGLARATGSVLTFVHVIRPIISESVFLSADMETVMKEAQDRLNGLVRSVGLEFNVQTRGIVVAGDPEVEIPKVAEIEKAEYIVMSSHEANPLFRFLIGGTTTSVIERSSSAVLAVPEKLSFSAPKSIVYATDYENSDIDALKQLVWLARCFDAEINVIHVASTDDEPETELAVNEYFTDLVRTRVPYDKIVCRVMKNKNVAKGIQAFAEKVGASLIALATRKHSFFETSLTKQFVRSSKVPVIAFHQHSMELYSEFQVR